MRCQIRSCSEKNPQDAETARAPLPCRLAGLRAALTVPTRCLTGTAQPVGAADVALPYGTPIDTAQEERADVHGHAQVRIRLLLFAVNSKPSNFLHYEETHPIIFFPPSFCKPSLGTFFNYYYFAPLSSFLGHANLYSTASLGRGFQYNLRNWGVRAPRTPRTHRLAKICFYFPLGLGNFSTREQSKRYIL